MGKSWGGQDRPPGRPPPYPGNSGTCSFREGTCLPGPRAGEKVWGQGCVCLQAFPLNPSPPPASAHLPPPAAPAVSPGPPPVYTAPSARPRRSVQEMNQPGLRKPPPRVGVSGRPGGDSSDWSPPAENDDKARVCQRRPRGLRHAPGHRRESGRAAGRAAGCDCGPFCGACGFSRTNARYVPNTRSAPAGCASEGRSQSSGSFVGFKQLPFNKCAFFLSPTFKTWVGAGEKNLTRR